MIFREAYEGKKKKKTKHSDLWVIIEEKGFKSRRLRECESHDRELYNF